MDPNKRTSVQTIQSPGFPGRYPNNADCTWEIKTKIDSKITMVFDSFNIEWSRNCKSRDYLLVGAIAKYSKVTLCGARLPKRVKFRSKKNRMIIKFKSNKRKRKSGFKAILVAN